MGVKNLERLQASLTGTGLPVVGVASVAAQHATDQPATFYQRPDGLVRVDWSTAPTQQQRTAADTLVQAFDPADTADEKTARLPPPVLLLAALVEVVYARAQQPPLIPPAWAVNQVTAAHNAIQAARS